MFEQISTVNFLGNSVQDYLWATGVFMATIIAFKVFKYLALKKIRKLVDHTTTKFDDLIIKSVQDIGRLFYLLLAFYVALKFIKVPAVLEKTIYYATLIVAVYYITKGLQRLLEHGVQQAARKKGVEIEDSITNILTKILKIGLWLIAIILILSNLGYNVSALLAGIGVGGIAIAFALQNILEDLFSAFSIYFDKPFEPGDFIIVGNDKGIVKKIGLKSTRLETLQGEQLTISNKELTQSRIHNYQRMENRRQTFEFGVTYDTSNQDLEKIPEMVEQIISNFELAEFNRAVFTEFGDSSLKFEVIYHVDTPDYNKALQIQQKINLALKEKFEQQGIAMAYPTRTIFINKK